MSRLSGFGSSLGDDDEEVVDGEIVSPEDERDDERVPAAVLPVVSAFDGIEQHADDFEIDDDARAQAVADFIVGTRSKLRWADQLRLEIVRPIKQHASNMDANFRRACAPANRAIETAVKKYDAYVDRVEREQQALALEQAAAARAAERAEQDAQEATSMGLDGLAGAAAQAAEEAREKADVLVPESTITRRVVKVGSGELTRKTSWVGEVIDDSLVPAEYRKTHQPLINDAVKRGVRSIPGVRIYPKNNYASKGS